MDHLQVPWTVFPFDPLAHHTDDLAPVLLVIPYGAPDDGHLHLGLLNGLLDLVLVHALGPLEDINSNLHGTVSDADHLGPLFPGRFGPGIRQLFGGLTCNRGMKSVFSRRLICS